MFSAPYLKRSRLSHVFFCDSGVYQRIFCFSLPKSLCWKVMILSRGETAYCGPARSMVEYFTTLGHPCEAYTNPLDEYGKGVFGSAPCLLEVIARCL